MFGFIHAFESSLMSIGMATLNGPRGNAPRTRVVRETSRGSTRKVLSALAATRAERDRLAGENARLKREVERLRIVARQR